MDTVFISRRNPAGESKRFEVECFRRVTWRGHEFAITRSIEEYDRGAFKATHVATGFGISSVAHRTVEGAASALETLLGAKGIATLEGGIAKATRVSELRAWSKEDGE